MCAGAVLAGKISGAMAVGGKEEKRESGGTTPRKVF